jgi:hypothetical protein
MNDDERDTCLTDIRITVARMRTDIHWLKRIMIAAAILICACLGVQVPDIFIHG